MAAQLQLGGLQGRHVSRADCRVSGLPRLFGIQAPSRVVKVEAARRKAAPPPFSPTGSSEETEAKAAARDAAIKEINRRFGAGTVGLATSTAHFLKIERFPSGNLTLDVAMGGGYPKGRIVEIFGPESSGKTTLALHAIAQVQSMGGAALFIDAEHALDVQYAKAVGVNMDSLILSQPAFGEQALEIAHAMACSNAVDLIVVDSVSALVPEAELKNEMGQVQPGSQARLMNLALRKLAGSVGESRCTIIFINQLRNKIGVLYGSPETTSGGKALPFYASIRMDVRAKDKLPDGKGGVRGHVARVKCVKNKTAPPYREATVTIVYGQGFDTGPGPLMDVAEKVGVVVHKGSGSYYFRDERLAKGKGAGREKVIEELRSNPELRAAIEAELKEKLQNAVVPLGGDEEAEEEAEEEFDEDDLDDAIEKAEEGM